MKQSVEWLVNNYMAHSYIISPLRMLVFTVRAVFVRSNKLGYKMHLLLNTKEITRRRRNGYVVLLRCLLYRTIR